MIKKTETIQVRLTNYGTIEVVSIPTRIYKDSYNVMKLSCIVPKNDIVGARICKVYATDIDESGNAIFTSATYNLPQKEQIVINGFDYIVYEDKLPQEFCSKNGNITLNFSEGIIDNQNEIVRNNVSGQLNLFVNGDGYNYAGVKISNYDGVASKVNELASKIDEVDNKVDNLDIPKNLSDLNDDIDNAVKSDIINALVDYYKKSETYSKTEVNDLISNVSSLSIQIVNELPTQNISTKTIYLVRGTQESQNLYKEYIYVNGQWELIGTQTLTLSADALSEVVEDSESIVAMVDGDKLKFELDAEITSKISKSLVVPMVAPTSTELVAIDDGNSQTMITLGGGLRLDGNVLSATGGGGGTGGDVYVVDNLVSQSSVDALSARQGNVLYNMIVDSDKEAKKQLILGAEGVLNGNVYNFTVENANDYLDYRTNLTKFLVDLNLPISGALDTTKEVTITFGNATYYVFNILKGMEHSTIGDLHQVDKYSNETGYRFIAEMTFFENNDVVGFAIIPTISMSDVLALDSDQMDNYLVDGGLTQGQLAVCKKVITNGYSEGAIYRFNIVYPNTYSWVLVSYSKEEVDKLISDLIDDAPDTLNTLKEIADWIKDDETGTTALINRVTNLENNKADKTQLNSKADKTELDNYVPKYSSSIELSGAVDLNNLFDENKDMRYLSTTSGQSNQCSNKPITEVNGFTLETHYMRKTTSSGVRTYIQKFDALQGIYFRTGTQNTLGGAVTWGDWKTPIDNVSNQTIGGAKTFTSGVNNTGGGFTVQKGTNWGQFVANSASGYYRAFEADDTRVRIDVRDTTETSSRRFVDIYSHSAKESNDQAIAIITQGTNAKTDYVATQSWVTTQLNNLPQGGGGSTTGGLTEEVIYSMSDTTKQTIGGTAYTSGITLSPNKDVKKEISYNFSKYKYVEIFASRFNAGAHTKLDLRTPNSSGTEHGGSIVFYENYDNGITVMLFHSEINASKNKLSLYMEHRWYNNNYVLTDNVGTVNKIVGWY